MQPKRVWILPGSIPVVMVESIVRGEVSGLQAKEKRFKWVVNAHQCPSLTFGHGEYNLAAPSLGGTGGLAQWNREGKGLDGTAIARDEHRRRLGPGRQFKDAEPWAARPSAAVLLDVGLEWRQPLGIHPSSQMLLRLRPWTHVRSEFRCWHEL